MFYGWLIVLGTFFANWLGAGLGIPVFGLFFKPMSEELGWTRSMTTLPLVTRNILSFALGPIIGPLVDRYGPRYLMAGGAVIVGLGTFLMYNTHSLWQFFLYFSVIGSIGYAGLSNVVTSTVISKWFVRLRGRATGLAGTGINVGEAVMTPLVVFLITTAGWRTAWMVLGIIPWVIIAPTSLFLMRRAPEDMGLRPDGDTDESLAAEREKPGRRRRAGDEHPWTVREAFRTPAMWVLILATNLASLAVAGVVMHQIPYLTDQGLSESVAALSLTLYAIFAIPSKLIWGFMAERVHIRHLSLVSMLGSAVGLLILLRADTVTEAVVFGVVYGLTRGAWHVIQSLIWADYFGRHFQGAIRGFVAPLQLVSTVGGPIFAAFVYDTTDSYKLAFSIFAVSFVLSGLLILAVRPPKPAAQAPAAAAA